MNEYAKLKSGLLINKSLASEMVQEAVMSQTGSYGNYPSTRSDNPSTMSWAVSSGSADSDIQGDLDTLRAQSRSLVRSNPIARGAVNTAKTNVIFTGLTPQSRIDKEFLGLTDDQAEKWQKNAERLFWMWADSVYSDSEQQLCWWEQQALAFGSYLESGDVIGIRRYIPKKWSKFALCYQWVEADRLKTPPEKSANKNIKMGVEFGVNGEPIYYYIYNSHPGDLNYFADTGYVKIPAWDEDGLKVALHVFKRERPGQSRGIPLLAPVMDPLRKLGIYTDAEISAAVVSAMFSVFIESPDADLAPNGLIPGMVSNGMNGSTQVAPLGQGLQKLKAGMIVEGKPGEKITTINPGRPNTAFDPFINSIITQIGMGINQPKEVMFKLYESSYTAARAAILDAKKTWDLERSSFERRACQPTWDAFLFEAIARGYLYAPGFLEDPEIRCAYCNAYWTGKPAGSVDPWKEANAEEKWLKMGAKTLQKVVQEQTGEDWKETADQRKLEIATLRDAGLLEEPATPASPDAEDQQDLEDDGLLDKNGDPIKKEDGTK